MMNNNEIAFTYRMATAKDVELLARTRVEFFADMNKDMTDEEKAAIYAQNRQYFEETFADGTFLAWLAFDGDTLVATSGVSFFRTPPKRRNPTGRTAYISNMFTKPEYRGRGVATRLFALSVELACEHGCGKVTLHASDMGRPIYEKFGFNETHSAMDYHIGQEEER